MPRLANTTYLNNRSSLGKYWRRKERGWSKLSFEDQCALHEYYEPSMDLTDDQAIAYREAVTAKWPSLPQRAGKAYVEFTKVIVQLEASPPPRPMTPLKRKHSRTPYVIRTEALVRSDIDFDKLSRVLLAVARDQADKKNAA
ncbi:hypothetical protein [Microbacterium sp. Leaf151]|uniref:hypothetical protein n=1 Tax=Microbacterium sp. Leaf151 TaxID=1736276 RepID=UPI0006F8B1A8|nr:hypothetical protein [Microbacterium sp. Leaf151]KQR23386.1 hypothetical protein ASF76_09340 [Microbacterium sp. Leaf151]